jgi:hypothetical protein
VNALEHGLATVHQRRDAVDKRLDRIERRLGLIDAEA